MNPLILIANDDGIFAKGIRYLTEIMREIGEVVVVAPDSPQSAMGHAITMTHPLRYYPSNLFEEVEAYSCSGTPADCIKLAKHHLLKGRVPDLVLSGINHGSNSSINVIYSGTMSAAIEAAIEDMPAIGFSTCDYAHNADFSHTKTWIKKITKQAINKPFPKGTALNINFPKNNGKALKGLRICRQARGKWLEKFDERTDPFGRKYLWLSGKFINPDIAEDTDEWALANNYVSLVPVSFDLTAHQQVESLKKTWRLD